MFDVDMFGEVAQTNEHSATLSRTWEYPPFSVLNARDGWWQERKRQWLALGIKSELGRGGGNVGLKSGHDASFKNQDKLREFMKNGK